jgi:hypothetical protein
MSNKKTDVPESREFIDIQNIKKQIADGIKKVRCPECNRELDIDDEKGLSGSVVYSYECRNKDCALKPGHVSVPWNVLLLRTFQGRAVQLIIGSITLGGLISFATGIIQIGPNVATRSGDFETHLQSLINNADNNFSRTQLEEILGQYKQITTEHHIDSERGRENVFVMARAADAARISIQGIGAFSPQAWDRELNPYLLANQRAAQRGVEVKRIFILPQDLTKPILEQFLAIMKRQTNLRIKVFYAFWDEIQLIPYYTNNPFSPCAYFDEKYFGYDLRTNITSASFPDSTRITWDKKEINEKCPFPDIFKSKYVMPFDDQTERSIMEHYNFQ